MAVGNAHVFPGFLTPVLTQLFFQKPPTTFLTCFCRGDGRKYAGKKSGLNRESNSQPSGHESYMLITEPPGRGTKIQWIQGDESWTVPSKTHTHSGQKTKWWPAFPPLQTMPFFYVETCYLFSCIISVETGIKPVTSYPQVLYPFKRVAETQRGPCRKR